jgi:hypothetical protein
VKLFKDGICLFVPNIRTEFAINYIKQKGVQLVFKRSLDSITITSFSIRMYRVILLKMVRYLLHFVITSKQHKTQGKEISISYEFSIIFEILVHYGVPHMACINHYMYITL